MIYLNSFYACPMIAYQLLITLVFDIIKDSFYTTSFVIIKNKSTENYKNFFRLNNNINKYLDINQTHSIREIHTDFEANIDNVCKLIYPGVKIKF